jgi:hypothetical protein
MKFFFIVLEEFLREKISLTNGFFLRGRVRGIQNLGELDFLTTI